MRAAEGQRFDPLRIAQGELLSDHPTHGDAKDVRLVDPQAVDDADGIVGEQRHRVRGIRLITLTDSAIIKDDRAKVLSEGGNVPAPADRTNGEAHDENQRLATAMFFVIDIDPVSAEVRHGRTTPISRG